MQLASVGKNIEAWKVLLGNCSGHLLDETVGNLLERVALYARGARACRQDEHPASHVVLLQDIVFLAGCVVFKV